MARSRRRGCCRFASALTREIDTHKNASAKFNWEKSILTHHDYKGVNDMPLPKGTQDRLSLLYHLPLLLKSWPGRIQIQHHRR